MKPRTQLTRILAAFLLLPAASDAAAPALPEFDFTRADTARAWGQPHHLAALRPTPEGLELVIDGDDPYFLGPPRDYPADTPLWLILRLKSDHAGSGEVFHFRDHPRAGQAVRFHVPAGRWTEARVPLPALGAGHRLRIDPPGTAGKVVLGSIRFERRVLLPEPSWPPWTAPESCTNQVFSRGGLDLYSGSNPFALELRVAGQRMAVAHPRPRLAYLRGEEVRWVDLADGAVQRDWRGPGGMTVTCRLRDGDGGEWTWQQSFRFEAAGAVACETRVSVSQDRQVVFLPMHLWVAGEGSFGRKKGQGLFAGLEYLEDEPSSSEADIIGPESNRRVPASHKITFPFMAIQADDRYVGLIWEDPARFSALFDSPDRTFGSGGHALGVLFPESDGVNREEGRLLPGAGQVLRANEPLTARAWLIGGTGRSVVPAVQQYVKLRGWPGLPDPGLNFTQYVDVAAQGWLESKCRETNLYRHAVWPGFNPQPAADAAVFELWLAAHSADAARAGALRQAAAGALSAVKPQSYYHSGVSHVRPPAAPLVFGAVREAIEAARQSGRAQLGRFAADGSVPYRAGTRGVDYGRTHFAPDANGLTAQVVATLLEAAAFSGDRELIAQGIAKLRALDKFRDGVPRGAQTWEVPLHTPDILASAHLVRAYTLGWELTGERGFLEQAIHWAWTGVPFVYLVNPTGQEVGPYSTLAVLGATSWKAPVWFGRPVQWCGMVYAEALHRLAPHDAAGPWKRLADGITSAALQHTWRADDRERVGLLPDFYELKEQTRAGPAINPGTVASGAARLYGRIPVYEFRALRRSGLLVHAPGAIGVESDGDRRAVCTVRGWSAEPYFVILNGWTNAPAVKINGAARTNGLEATKAGWILQLSGEARLELVQGNPAEPARPSP